MKKRFLLLFFLISLFLFCFQLTSFAYDNMTLVDFPGGDTSNNRKDLLEDILSYTGLDNYSFYNTDSETQFDNAFTSGFMNINNYATYRFVKLTSGGYSLELSYSTNDKVVQGSGIQPGSHAYIPTKRFYYNIQNNTLRVTWSSYNNGTMVDTVPASGFDGYYILCQLPGGWYEYRYNVDFTVSNYINLIWNKNTTSTIAVTSNGVTKDIPLYKYSRSVNSFKLGYFTNWQDTHIEVSVGPYVADNISDNSWGKATISKYGDILNGNKIGFVKNGNQLELWCSLPYYLYNQTYNLLYTYRKDQSQNWQNGYFDFVIMPYGSTDTTANLVNPELDNNTDVAFVNQLDYLLTTNSGEVDNSVNSMFNIFGSGDYLSGDLFSGDIFGKLSYHDYTNNRYNMFIYKIYREILACLNDNGVDDYIQFELHGHTYKIYASQFTVPNGPIKTLINIFLVGGLIILFIQQFYAFFISVTTLDLHGFTKTFDKDHTFFM